MLSELQGQQRLESDFVQIDADNDEDIGFTDTQSRLVAVNEDLLGERVCYSFRFTLYTNGK
jgi:c-di-GMP-binding flagellar brake protein YcgR